MKKIDPKWLTLKESLKEPLRLVALAVISWIITVIIPQLDEKWVPILVVFFRWLDKWVHEYRSEKGIESVWKGLIGF